MKVRLLSIELYLHWFYIASRLLLLLLVKHHLSLLGSGPEGGQSPVQHRGNLSLAPSVRHILLKQGTGTADHSLPLSCY